MRPGRTELEMRTSQGQLADKVRETRLSWFGHVRRRDSKYIGQRMPSVELQEVKRRSSVVILLVHRGDRSRMRNRII